MAQTEVVCCLFVYQEQLEAASAFCAAEMKMKSLKEELAHVERENAIEKKKTQDAAIASTGLRVELNIANAEIADLKRQLRSATEGAEMALTLLSNGEVAAEEQMTSTLQLERSSQGEQVTSS